MSRCFPYPPPGYILSDAAIESKKRLLMEKNKRTEKMEKRRQKRRRLISESDESGLSEERGRPEISGEQIRSISEGMSDAVLNIRTKGMELRRYKCLMANWFPPPLEDASVDSDWLQSEGSRSSSALGSPVTVFALPYVIPY